MNYPPILKDEKLEKRLLDDGYLIIRNFLSAEAVAQLTEYYESNLFEIDRDTIFNTIAHTNDIDYKKRTIDEITSVYRPFCDKYFTDYKLFGGSFVVKPGGGKGTSQPHIDWTTVDEEKFRSFSLWIPLIELNKRNGALGAVKGSHKFNQLFRGPNIPDQIIDLRDWFWENSETEYLAPGDVFIYDYRTVHCSRENFTPTPRVAVSCSITSTNAQTLVYFWNEQQKIVSAYKSTIEMYLDGKTIVSLPENSKPLKYWDYRPNQLSKADFPHVGIKSSNSVLEKMIDCISSYIKHRSTQTLA